MRVASVVRRSGLVVAAVAAAVAAAFVGLGAASTAVPVGHAMKGEMTFYNNSGFGACGTQINAATQMLVAVSHTWWTAPNPNNDPLCQGVSVEVTYHGKTITVPVEDKCPSCASNHLDLSQPAFAALAPLSVGIVHGIHWKFVKSTGAVPGGPHSGTSP